jgi:hypothetical protein
MACVLQNNFLNCPENSYNAVSECDAMKNLVKTTDKCGGNFDGTFLLSIWNWVYEAE